MAFKNTASDNYEIKTNKMVLLKESFDTFSKDNLYLTLFIPGGGGGGFHHALGFLLNIYTHAKTGINVKDNSFIF